MATDGYRVIVSKLKSTRTSPNREFQLDYRDGATDSYEFWAANDSAAGGAGGGKCPVHYGQWDFVVGVYDGSLLYVYENGVLCAT